MLAHYNGYKIITEKRGQAVYFDVYLGSRQEAAGFILDGFGDKSMEYATHLAKNLIEADFNTPVLQEIRKIPKY